MSGSFDLIACEWCCGQVKRRVGGSRCSAGGTGWRQLDEPEPLLALTSREASSAAAVFERMFPSDDGGPGARQIGVVTYLDRALAGAYREYIPVYRVGLALLDRVSRDRFG